MPSPVHRALDAALRKLDDGRHTNPAAKSRRFCRFPARGEARLWPGYTTDESPNPITTQIRDISRGGLGVLSPEPAAPGTFWQIQLCSGEIAVATVPGFCRFCRQVVPGAHLIGIEFGVEAGILMALGVSPEQLARDEGPEEPQVDHTAFVPPQSLMGEQAA